MVGSVALIRVSSPMTPFLSGTLKSTRMNTRFPARSRSLIESFDMGVREQDAVFNGDGNHAQRFARLVQARPRRAIELPPVERTLEARALVVDRATLVRADIRQKHEPRTLAHEKVCPPPLCDDSGQSSERVDGPDAKDYSPFLTSSRSRSTQ